MEEFIRGAFIESEASQMEAVVPVARNWKNALLAISRNFAVNSTTNQALSQML
jgi:hypothetical protein